MAPLTKRQRTDDGSPEATRSSTWYRLIRIECPGIKSAEYRMSRELSTETVERVWCKAHNLRFEDMVFEEKNAESTKVVCLNHSGEFYKEMTKNSVIIKASRCSYRSVMLKREFTSTPFKHRDDQDLLTALRSHLDTQSDRVFVKCAIYMDFMPGRPAQFESLMSGDVVKEGALIWILNDTEEEADPDTRHQWPAIHVEIFDHIRHTESRAVTLPATGDPRSLLLVFESWCNVMKFSRESIAFTPRAPDSKRLDTLEELWTDRSTFRYDAYIVPGFEHLYRSGQIRRSWIL